MIVTDTGSGLHLNARAELSHAPARLVSLPSLPICCSSCSSSAPQAASEQLDFKLPTLLDRQAQLVLGTLRADYSLDSWAV